jgi:hypothetical protein
MDEIIGIEKIVPKRDAVIVEIVDGRFVTSIECKNPENEERLKTMAYCIVRYAF